jgi:peptide-methionine (S)-S-oxide reductase
MILTMQDTVFQAALDALDNGDAPTLDRLLTDNPGLAAFRAAEPAEGYFARPYLLWYIADNPIRRGTLAPNISELATILLRHIKTQTPDTFPYQRDYALGLVATGRIPKERGVQFALIDLLLANGGTPGNGIGAMAHGNPETARYLIEKNGNWTLAAAAGLGETRKAAELLPTAEQTERELALVVAAFYGRVDLIEMLVAAGIDPNVYPQKDSGFHSHATALHQAVWSGNPDAVGLLLAAGADPTKRDLIFNGTPLGWAEYGLSETVDPQRRENLTRMAELLRQAAAS